jgi:hypothetical protein
MRTIRLERTDKSVPLPNNNPMTLHAVEDANFCLGDIRYIKTGLRFYFPVDIQPRLKSLVPGLVILGSTQPEVDGCFQLIVACVSMEVRLGKSQRVATVSLHEMALTSVRFAEFSDSKRVICGGPEPTIIP